MILNYHSYILESVKNESYTLYLLNDFTTFLKSPIFMGNKIADKILSGRLTISEKINYINISDNNDTISYLPIDKLKQMLGKTEPVTRSEIRQSYFKLKDEITNSPLRQKLKIGRFIKKLFGEEFGDTEIELFVNKFKSAFDYKDLNFELVDGAELLKYYRSTYYEKTWRGSLNQSCMKYDRCKEYVNLYALNSEKIKLLILKKVGSNKICGRALVWVLDEPEGIIFMDRIYYNYDHDVQSFITYADMLGWYHKKYNGAELKDEISIVLNNTEITTKMSIQLKDLNYEKFPYLDTLKWYNPQSKILSTYKITPPDKSYILTGTSGNFIVK